MHRPFAKLAMGLALVFAAGTSHAAEPTKGNPKLQSIESLAFAPDGLLLIADGKGAQIVAVHTNDTKASEWGKLDGNDLKQQIGAQLNAKTVDFVRFVVNPASNRGYLAVKADGKETILTIDGSGKIATFDLSNVNHTRYPLSADGKATPIRITDLTYADGRALFATVSKEGAKIYTVDLRQDGVTPNWVSAETYHVGHGKWETGSPIRTVIPYVEGGKTYLVGAFTCTPIVKYSLDDVKVGGGKVKGTSVVELGTGNTPQDMFAYSKDGKNYILMNQMRNNGKAAPGYPTAYWTAKVEQGILAEKEAINEKAPWRIKGKAGAATTNRAVMVPEFANIVAMDKLGDDRALVIQTDDKAGYRLAVLPLP
ncbi:MAG: hypothetical protein U0744_05275 [Gemmataceae bacterium]